MLMSELRFLECSCLDWRLPLIVSALGHSPRENKLSEFIAISFARFEGIAVTSLGHLKRHAPDRHALPATIASCNSAIHTTTIAKRGKVSALR